MFQPLRQKLRQLLRLMPSQPLRRRQVRPLRPRSPLPLRLRLSQHKSTSSVHTKVVELNVLLIMKVVTAIYLMCFITTAESIATPAVTHAMNVNNLHENYFSVINVERYLVKNVV